MDFEIKVLHVKANRLKKRKGDVDMDLPEISRKIGIVHEDRLVYIEEYVLQYLELLKGQESQRGRKIFLYGKSERTSRAETYIIYAACGQEEEEEWKENDQKQDDQQDENDQNLDDHQDENENNEEN